MTTPTTPPNEPTPSWDRRAQHEARRAVREARLAALRMRNPEAWRSAGGSGLSHLAMGIFLTLLGGVLTLDRLNIVDASHVLRFWPIGFHVLGATILLHRTDSHGRFWGIAWLVVGTWLLVNSLGIASVSFFDLIWPLVLITIGVRLILRGRAKDAPEGAVSSSPSAEPASVSNLVAVLGESKGSVKETLTKASMTSVLGGCHLDLRLATIPAGERPVIDVFTVMGGQEIVVPPGWAVDFDVVSILAGTADKRLPSVATALDSGMPRVTIRGVLILGGLTVSN
jgi:hypothetical protein